MAENFYRDFISRIKRNVSNNPEIFSEKLDEDDSRNEKESIVDEYNTDDSRSIQDRMMSILSSNDTAGIFTSFLDRFNNQQNLVSPSSGQGPSSSTSGIAPQAPSSSSSGIVPQGPSSSSSGIVPQGPSTSGVAPQGPSSLSSSSSFGPQTTSSSGSSFGPQTPSSSSSNSSTLVPSSSNIQQPQVLPVGGMQISSIPSNAPLWIRNLYDKYVDILPPITVPLSNHDKVGRQMFFDEIITWINIYLQENGVILPDDIREIRDVIIP
ncbi:immunodominant virion protein [Flamingopox virus FGPVKD09]|uniref:Immunodominant virion protein n=1 Tax=Flamingopox virus FGPVKD09 TaxID=2059380 RepID=A0A2H4X2H3_9POXV|nr:immunodominant virion protein [Flamingopox virus FGPVKD09]AUD40275.1 immunodominant virion protein [Flamingopox virus FGPVKD09]